ncbi:TetR/AcrR family transcriptional regulator [Frigidibacter sp. MR17.24]|uniref:TetR/AcrR family transcriptional regulator n=1 Tax=Frigidibacter sp. MR17.24 TaxID=3127345 RepID=UPI003012DF9C
MRADARRNREALIATAGAAFAADGVSASLEEIARRAGVGIGTLYRHFPTREDLVEAVYRREVEELCAAADRLLAEHPADRALELWLQRFIDYAATKRGLIEGLRVIFAAGTGRLSDISGRISGALERLIRAAREAGLIRTDLGTEDVLHALTAIHAAPQGPDWRDRSLRLVQLVMDGLRCRA